MWYTCLNESGHDMALLLNGVDQWAERELSRLITDPVSIFAYIRTGDANQSAAAFSLSSSSITTAALSAETLPSKMVFCQQNDNIETAPKPKNAGWAKVLISATGGSLTLRLNRPDNMTIGSGSPLNATSNKLIAGGKAVGLGTVGALFKGEVAFYRAWNKELSEAEAKELLEAESLEEINEVASANLISSNDLITGPDGNDGHAAMTLVGSPSFNGASPLPRKVGDRHSKTQGRARLWLGGYQ